jgi:hypothetical protein
MGNNQGEAKNLSWDYDPGYYEWAVLITCFTVNLLVLFVIARTFVRSSKRKVDNNNCF